MTTFLEKLNDLVICEKKSRKDTFLLGIDVNVPWDYNNWASVSFYDVRLDSDVTDYGNATIQHMTGCDINPHVTLGIANMDQCERFEKFKRQITDDDLQSISIVCKEELCFPQSRASKDLGAKGCAVVMKLEVSKELNALRNALLHSVPCPKDVFGDVAVDHLWKPHVTVGYVREDDQENKKRLMDSLSKFRGQPVKVLGWYY
ncbi:SWPV1-033 [Shearwaterpox virus]|uniref:SWPV1-033 n=1 Tax=Shearwaterpox virus TaxID=1974596 RepID=A0A1V0S7P8_CNPV|nr:SWPV1-033 [Shearwaterpox virus]